MDRRGEQPPGDDEHDEDRQPGQPDRMRPGEEEDRQRAGGDVGCRPAADRNERAEPLGEDAERGRDDDADRPEVRPRLTDDARRGIARHGLVREETRIDPVAEVRDVVAAQQRREPGLHGHRAVTRGRWARSEILPGGPVVASETLPSPSRQKVPYNS